MINWREHANEPPPDKIIPPEWKDGAPIPELPPMPSRLPPDELSKEVVNVMVERTGCRRAFVIFGVMAMLAMLGLRRLRNQSSSTGTVIDKPSQKRRRP